MGRTLDVGRVFPCFFATDSRTHEVMTIELRGERHLAAFTTRDALQLFLRHHHLEGNVKGFGSRLQFVDFLRRIRLPRIVFDPPISGDPTQSYPVSEVIDGLRSELRPTVLFEGHVSKLTVKNPQDGVTHSLLNLFDLEHDLEVAGVPKVDLADQVRAVCCLDERNKYIVIDLIVGSNKRRITDEQRVEQERRLGISLLYQRKQVDFSSQSVISKITEIESQLVEYLAKHPELMREMNYDAFEKLVAELLASHGFDVEWTGRNNATAGDVIAFKTDSETDLTSSFIVECKRYAPDRPVGIEVARAIYGAKCDERFSNALLVTTSSFQRGVEQFSVRRWDFQLKDFKGLVEWLNRYRPKPDGRLHMDDSKRIWRSFE